MDAIIYDNPDEHGIDLEFDMENGMAIRIFMSDDAALDMIQVIQNKINARL